MQKNWNINCEINDHFGCCFSVGNPVSIETEHLAKPSIQKISDTFLALSHIQLSFIKSLAYTSCRKSSFSIFRCTADTWLLCKMACQCWVGSVYKQADCYDHIDMLFSCTWHSISLKQNTTTEKKVYCYCLWKLYEKRKKKDVRNWNWDLRLMDKIKLKRAVWTKPPVNGMWVSWRSRLRLGVHHFTFRGHVFVLLPGFIF